MAGTSGHPHLQEAKPIPKAPMCVRFQAIGQCKEGCSFAQITASRMTAEARAKVDTCFKAVYTTST